MKIPTNISLPAALKAEVKRRADARGLSVSTWIIQAILDYDESDFYERNHPFSKPILNVPASMPNM